MEQGSQARWWQILVVFAVLLGMAGNGVSQSNSKMTIVPRTAVAQAMERQELHTTRQSAAVTSDVSLEGAVDERLSATFGGSLTPGERSQVAVSRGGDDSWQRRSRVSAMTASASCGWEEGFWISDLDGIVEALVVYDDGGGEALYAGGRFTSAGGVIVNHIAKWDGASWSALFGPTGPGVDDRVEALVVFDDGSGEALYAGGRFTSAGGAIVNHIAKWDGVSWSALSGPSASGVFGNVSALALYDDGGGEALYAGGSFESAGGVIVDGIAKWDGVSWSALSGPFDTGVNSRVHALAVYNDGNGEALYAGGSFTSAGGVSASRVARWDGVSWSALSGPSGTGVDDRVEALAVYDDGSGEALYAGGWFESAGGVIVNQIAKWDGASWSALSGTFGSGVSFWVSALAVYDDGSGEALYAGGWFASAGGVIVNQIAKWDGESWTQLSGPAGIGVNFWVFALAVYDDGSGAALYTGGSFTSAGGEAANRIARWDGSSWSALSEASGTGASSTVWAMAVYDDGSGEALYVGGEFIVAGGVIVNNIAKWDGVSWSALSGPFDTGVDSRVHALAVYDDGSGEALYASGWFESAGGVSVDYIAKWDGVSWTSLSGPAGHGFNDVVFALAVYDDGSGEALYAGGRFIAAGWVSEYGIAKWDGASWSSLSGPNGYRFNDSVYALAVYDDGSGDGLYAGGSFSSVGGVAVSRIAKWDGTTWSALSPPAGTGVYDSVYTLAVYDDGGGDELYVGGSGYYPLCCMAKWNGVSWSTLSELSETGDSVEVYALAVHDDGSGEALYVGGWFTSVGGLMVNNIAKWNGISWTALSRPTGSGIKGGVSALVGYDDGSGDALYVGGNFTSAGGLASSNIAKWNGDTDSDSDGACDNFDRCPGLDDGADADGDGVPDGCDVCLGFDDNNDTDTDGVPDGCDICPGADDSIDRDANGIPDGCEPRWIQGRH